MGHKNDIFGYRRTFPYHDRVLPLLTEPSIGYTQFGALVFQTALSQDMIPWTSNQNSF